MRSAPTLKHVSDAITALEEQLAVAQAAKRAELQRKNQSRPRGNAGAKKNVPPVFVGRSWETLTSKSLGTKIGF